MNGSLVGSYVVPVHPHPLLVPEQNEGWSRIRAAFDEARAVSYTQLTLPTKRIV